MNFLKELWTRLMAHDCMGLAAEMAYNWMLSLLPTLIFIVDMFGLFGVRTETFSQVMGTLHRVIPGDALFLIRSSIIELTQDSSGGLAVAGFLGALWTASNGARTIEKAINRAYGRLSVNGGFWRSLIISFWIVVGMAILLMVCTNLIVFGHLLIDLIQRYLQVPQWMITLLSISRWVIPLAALLIISSFIYFTAPALGARPGKAKLVPHRVWPGAITFVAFWMLVSWLFSLYVVNMGNYGKFYGPMGAIIILMVWLYLTSLAIIIGGEVNAMLYQGRVMAQKQGSGPVPA